MSFIKFGLDDTDETEHKLNIFPNIANTDHECQQIGSDFAETQESKFKVINEIFGKNEETQAIEIEQNQEHKLNERKSTKCDSLKRKSKDINYKDCKDDVNHLFYIKTRAQRRVRHSYIPSLNKGKIALDPEDFLENVYPHCTVSEISPIYFAKKQTDNLDTCFARTLAHGHYKIRMTNTRTRYLNTLKTDRKLRKYEKDSVYSQLLFTFAERLESHPDPYFYRNYDFYYTGGNICVLPTETHNILHVDGADFSTLKLSTCPLNAEPNVTTFQECITKKLKTDTEIFEICQLKSLNDQQSSFAVRQMKNVTLFTIDQANNQIEPLIELKTETVPFISLAQSQENPEMFVLSNMKQRLHVYDVAHTANVTVQNLYKMENENSSSIISWNRIKPLHDQTFVYANERQLCLIDFRLPQHDWLKTECSFSSKEFPCEFNSSLAISEFNDLMYIGTTHKLRCVDKRYLNQRNNFENVSVCEWTHELDYSPAFLDVIRDGTHEYIVCASPIPGDVRICELTQTKSEKSMFKSYCLPWQPPTLQEAYENACLSGKVFKPEANLKKRIEACRTGLAFLKTKDYMQVKAFFIQANSNGDVYAQTLQHRQQDLFEQRRTSEKGEQIMSNYANELSKLPQPNLNYTDVIDMKAFRKILLCPQLRENQYKSEKEAAAEQQEKAENAIFKQYFKGRWQKSMSTLHNYKDALAKDLLSIWDIPYEDETDLKYSELKKKFKSDKSEKYVLNWLNRDETPAPITSIPLSTLKIPEMNLNTTDINTSNYDTDFEYKNTSGLLNISTLLETSWSTPAKPKIAKPKKKHVKGF